MPRFAVILPAAGSSTRFGGSTNKLLADLGGEPVLSRALGAFLRRDDVAQLVISTRMERGQLIATSTRLAAHLSDARVTLCAGGESRADSVKVALAAVNPETEWVAIHDAARPLVSQSLIDTTLAAAERYGAAVPALPVSLTIKQATGPLPAQVERTVPRQSLWAMQTPQIMRRATLSRAFDTCPIPLDQITDDAQLLELVGEPVWLVQGEERNLKVTTGLDLQIANLLLQADPR